ncbi:hypothetical protein [Reinekea sp. G2M2-21]|nr:hypothetical protein [Reinekea sp. G2M2-21]
MQNTQQFSGMDLQDPEDGAAILDFIVKPFAKIKILPTELPGYPHISVPA